MKNEYLKSYYDIYFGRYTKIPFDEVPNQQIKIIVESIEYQNHVKTMEAIKTVSLSVQAFGTSMFKFSEVVKEASNVLAAAKRLYDMQPNIFNKNTKGT